MSAPTMTRARVDALRPGQLWGRRRVVGIVHGFSAGRPVVYVTTEPRDGADALARLSCNVFPIIDQD